MSVPPASEQEICQHLAKLNGFRHEGNKLTWSYQFCDFKEAFAFLTRVALYSESVDHHPEIFNCYNRVEIALTTHDAGNRVSKKDLTFATYISQLFKST